MRIRFLGTGDAFGSGGRAQTCFVLDTAGGLALLDCGATAMVSLARAGVDRHAIETVLITHLHGDHFGGLPFFILDGQFGGRTRPLLIAGPPGLHDRTLQAMDVLFPGSASARRAFETVFVELPEERPTEVPPGLRVTPWRVVHGSGAPPYAYRIEAEGRVFTYSGDTEWTEALIAAAAGADLFVCECYSFDKRIRTHVDYRTLQEQRARLDCARLLLTHAGPSVLEHRAALALELLNDGDEVEL